MLIPLYPGSAEVYHLDMPSLPVLETERLRLRSPEDSDVPRITALAGDREIAMGTLTMPHPYSEKDAREWLERCRSGVESGTEQVFAIALRDSDELIGACGLHHDRTHRIAELGYWTGRPYWGAGYAIEAVGELLAWATEAEDLDKIFGRVFVGNDRSSRLLARAGMAREGVLRQHLIRWGERKDIEMWGVLLKEHTREEKPA